MTVYGSDNKKDGNITDGLLDHDGKSAHVVIGVGGFLGLGKKDVAPPYGEVQFTDQPMTYSTESASSPAVEQPGMMEAGPSVHNG